MKLLTISLVNSCNRDCAYCPTKRFHKPLDYKFPYVFVPTEENPVDNFTGAEKEASRLRINNITNDALLSWLEKYIDPQTWILELTGGEPGLYEGINELVQELARRGYKGMVKTNGDHAITSDPASFPTVVAWHDPLNTPPTNRGDVLLIIRNYPDDQWQAKIQYCEDHDVPYKTTQYSKPGKIKGFDVRKLNPINKITHYLHINSIGQITACPEGPVDEKATIFNQVWVEPKNLLKDRCIQCKNVTDVEKFLPPEIREKAQADYDVAVAQFSANVRR